MGELSGQSQRYQGVIKSFDPGLGFGLIECGDSAAFSWHRTACSVHYDQVVGFKIGDHVTFSVSRSSHCPGKPQAFDLAHVPTPSVTPSEPSEHVAQRTVTGLVTGQAVGQTKNHRSMALDQLEQVVFTGVIKNLNNSTGYGFIDSAEAYALFGREAVIHQSQCEGISAGSSVQFRLQLKQGKPYAFDVEQLSAAAVSSQRSICNTGRTWAGPDVPIEETDGRLNPEATTWKPSLEADHRAGMAAALTPAHPPWDGVQGVPKPLCRTGAFLSWRTN